MKYTRAILAILVVQVSMFICNTWKCRSSVGETIVLKCRCNCTLTHARWRKDGQILSSGLTAYTRRLSVKSRFADGQYDLQIRDIQLDDAGKYICEIKVEGANVRIMITVDVFESSTSYATTTHSSNHTQNQDVDTDKHSYDMELHILYITIGSVLFAVLLLSVLCNAVIHRYRRREDITRIQTRNQHRIDQRQETNSEEDQSLNEHNYDDVIDDYLTSEPNRQVQLPLNLIEPRDCITLENNGSIPSTDNNSYLEVVDITSTEGSKYELNNPNKELSRIPKITQEKRNSQSLFYTTISKEYTSLHLQDEERKQFFHEPSLQSFDIATLGNHHIPPKRATYP